MDIITDKNGLPVSRNMKYVLVWNSEDMKNITGTPYDNPNHYPCILIVFDLMENGENIQRAISIGIGHFAEMFVYVQTAMNSVLSKVDTKDMQ